MRRVGEGAHRPVGGRGGGTWPGGAVRVCQCCRCLLLPSGRGRGHPRPVTTSTYVGRGQGIRMGDAEEKAALSIFLSAQRASVLAIIDGLDEEALTTPILPSGWTPLGLIEHLGYAERHWFQEILTGTADPLPWPEDHTPLATARPP